MAKSEEVIEYNREMKQFLSDVWNEVPKGRQKQFLKNPLNKALLTRFHIIEGDEQSKKAL